MSFIAGLLTFAIIIVCLMLIGLVLIQLPKKDAGAGLAFGSGAADALFGAGSGNALTGITKWMVVAFLLLALLLGYLQDSLHSKGDASTFMQQVQQKQSATTAPAAAPQTTAPANNLPAAIPAAISNAAAAVVSTNAAK